MAWGSVGVVALVSSAVGVGSWVVGSIDWQGEPPLDMDRVYAVSYEAKEQPPAPSYGVDPALFDPRPMFKTAAANARVATPMPPPAGAPAAVVPVPDPSRAAVTRNQHRQAEPHQSDSRQDGGLTLAEIGRIKNALNLSPEQQPLWAPVEAALREIVAEQGRGAGARGIEGVSQQATQRLYWAASPLIATLRDDQKREVRKRARSLGLSRVAALI